MRMTEDIIIQEEPQPSEAEIVFNSTTSKKNLSGVRGRASRTGRRGAVKTPVDFLRGKAKKEYMKNSEVIVYNMYDERVLPYEEFVELPVEKQVVLMTKWRDEIGTNNIIKDMKISRKKFYSEVLKSLGIETKPRGRRPKREHDVEFGAMETVSMVDLPKIGEAKLQMPAASAEQSLYISFNGIFNGHSLTNRLVRLARVLDANGLYEIRAEVKER